MTSPLHYVQHLDITWLVSKTRNPSKKYNLTYSYKLNLEEFMALLLRRAGSVADWEVTPEQLPNIQKNKTESR